MRNIPDSIGLLLVWIVLSVLAVSVYVSCTKGETEIGKDETWYMVTCYSGNKVILQSRGHTLTWRANIGSSAFFKAEMPDGKKVILVGDGLGCKLEEEK